MKPLLDWLLCSVSDQGGGWFRKTVAAGFERRFLKGMVSERAEAGFEKLENGFEKIPQLVSKDDF